MKMQRLQWDSDFYGLNIYSVYFDNDLELPAPELRQLFRKAEADLIYIFLPDGLFKWQANLLEAGAQLYDRKVTYEKKMSGVAKGLPDGVSEYEGELCEELIHLSLLAGEHSRFKNDPGLSSHFKELYTKWIKNSLNKKLADKIFIIKHHQLISGFITCKIRDGIGNIGLVAIDIQIRGKGFGRRLIESVENYYKHNTAKLSTVVTQLENKQACRFYESCGYNLQKLEYVYHWWHTKNKI